LRRNEHAVGDGFAMPVLAVLGDCLERVSGCVPEVQDHARPASRSSAETTLLLIRHDSAITGVSAPGCARRSPCVRARSDRRARAGRHPVLDHLVQAGPKFAARQGAQHGGIDDDRVRLVKRSDHVLTGRMVDADLAADGAVHLRQQRRRDMHNRDAAQIGGCREPAMSPMTPPPNVMTADARSAFA
jgi:hypothetical protein